VYGSENWALYTAEKRITEKAEMKLIRSVASIGSP
jgi:hypothetical protein